MANPTAQGLKAQGNDAFSKGSYKEAETFYTRAISNDPSNALLYSNRAFARLKLSSWESCIDDCLRAIELQPENSMKAYHRLAQAQLALRHPNEALSSALKAYEFCLQSRADSSAGAISALVLEAKKQKWENAERERLRRRAPLLAELEEGLVTSGKALVEDVRERMERAEVGDTQGREEIGELELETRRKVDETRSVFAVADPENAKRREVPDYMIDSITFGIMFDPVITKRGQSYERSTLEQHLKSSQTDPLTREPLKMSDLRPNLALKQACADFLEENGWAVDW